MIKIIDNFLEKDLSIYLEQYFLEIPHNFGWTSKGLGEGIPFYQANLNPYDPLIKFLCLKVQQQVDHKIGFIRVYINIHYSNMPGDFHEDDGDTTFVLMTSKTLQKGSGQFQIQINNNVENIQKIDFIQNRLIIFPALWKHRGLDPIEHATPRVTLAFKTSKI
jgi:hypothetical protein